MPYVHPFHDWPNFTWAPEAILMPLGIVRHLQGKLLGKMSALGFVLQQEAELETLTLDVLKSTEIEGEFLNPQQVRSSIARRLGMDIAADWLLWFPDCLTSALRLPTKFWRGCWPRLPSGNSTGPPAQRTSPAPADQ